MLYPLSYEGGLRQHTGPCRAPVEAVDSSLGSAV